MKTYHLHYHPVEMPEHRAYRQGLVDADDIKGPFTIFKTAGGSWRVKDARGHYVRGMNGGSHDTKRSAESKAARMNKLGGWAK